MASSIFVSPKNYNLPIHTNESMRQDVMSKYKFGQYIRDDDNQRVRIVAFYPNFVLCHNGYGYEVCIGYYDLWIGLQKG